MNAHINFWRTNEFILARTFLLHSFVIPTNPRISDTNINININFI